jgi:WD40 repeat protein
MAEVTRALDSPAPEEGKPPEYDAFLSYAHRDRQVTIAIQKGLHQIGRRLGRLRALRVFRDDTNLTASPDLWGKITEALDRSGYMIVVLSPQSAASHWVNEEVSYWLQHRGHEQLMLALAEGHLRWDATTERFDPEQSDAAPRVLTAPRSLPSEPLYIDVSDDAPWDLGSLTFRDKVTALAAPIHGKPKDQLAGDDLREQRRFRRLRAAAITGLAVLTVVAVVAALIAVAKQREANRQRQDAIQHLHDAVVAKMNAEGASMLAGLSPGGDVRALQELLAANAIEANGVPVLNAQIARFTTQKIINPAATSYVLAYSPDGRRIVTGHIDGTLRQWDPATGKPVGAPMKGTGIVNAVAYTPDGQTIASASQDGTMRLWNANTGAPLNPNPQHVERLGRGIAVSPNGKVIFTGSANDTIQAWDPQTGQLLATQLAFDDHRVFINDVVFDRSGHLFAVSGNNGGIAIYDTRPFQLHAPIITVMGPGSLPAQVWQVAFSPDAHTIAVGSENPQLELWNADTGTLIRTIRAGPSTAAFVIAVAFSPDGHRVATGRSDGALQLWDADTGAPLGQTSIGHTGPVTNLAFSPDGRQIATVSLDGTLRLWSATVGQPMRGPDPVVGQVAFSPDGQRLAASGDTAVQQWDVNSGQPLPPLTGGGTGVHFIGYVDGDRIVTAADDGTVQVWNATGQPARPPVHIAIGTGDFRLAFTGDGHTLASADLNSGTIRLWDVATGQPIGPPMTIDPPADLISLAFSPDGHRLVAGYSDGARLWNTDTAQPQGPVMTDPELKGVPSVAFSRDGATVAAASVDGAVELWDTHTHKQLPDSPLHGHTGQATRVAFGVAHQFVSGGADATLRLWDTATGQPTAAPQTGSDMVTGVAVSPDGRLAAWSAFDGTVRLSPAIADPSQLCDKLSTNMSHKHWREWVSPGIGYISVCPGLPIAPD